MSEELTLLLQTLSSVPFSIIGIALYVQERKSHEVTRRLLFRVLLRLAKIEKSST
jgi:hypothetical protein